MRFPLTDSSLGAENAPGAGEGPAALVVGSDRDSSLALCGYLADLGFHVTAVMSGVGAVIAARNKVPSVIFVDVQLADVTGAELVTWLRANPALAKVPVVALHSLGEDGPNLKTAGFNACLRKPTSSAKVAEVLKGASLGAS